ncbi:MAG TPA: metal ABC transporter permease [Candidatus Saccharimonadales bacterium]
MPEIFQYDFMVRAMVAGLLAALVVPVLGSFLVARRYSLIADSLAHVSLAGVGAGLLLGVAPLVVAVPLTAAGALLLEWLRQNRRLSGEIGLAILMSGGLALAVVLANLAKNTSVDFSSYLFGSIATTTVSDVVTLAVAAVVVLAVVLLNFRALLHIAYDEDSARITGYRVSFFNYLLAVMTSVMVVLSLRIVGGLLISALLVVPVVTASRLVSGFRAAVVTAVVAAAVAVVVGLLAAFYVGIAAGGAIVLASLALLAATLIRK